MNKTITLLLVFTAQNVVAQTSWCKQKDSLSSPDQVHLRLKMDKNKQSDHNVVQNGRPLLAQKEDLGASIECSHCKKWLTGNVKSC